MLHLWDGRCGHCGASLLTSDEVEGITEEPFEVDHIEPRSCGGLDTITNYMAACWSCNNSRRDAQITDARTCRRIDFIRSFVDSEGFPAFIAGVIANFERAIRDHAYFLLARCFDHSWHVYGSPFQAECHASCDSRFDGFLRDEWWSRFGSYSAWAQHVVGENLHIRGLVRGFNWWQCADGLDTTLPRYCRSPFEIADVLGTMEHLGDRPPSEAAPMWQFSAFHTLSGSVQRRALSMADSAAAASLAVNKDLVDHGIHSPALRRLWAEKQWPTSHLIYYSEAARLIQTPGQLQGHLRALRKLTTGSQAEDYLRWLSDPDAGTAHPGGG
ncbi:hypothetical protein BKG69_15960 [Mycobacteroides chelonae]|uniref:HNH endonuclease n=1 Tax=Mycobacteroides chelonae TaxID=1774 RepID=UPI0008A8432E|nr:hypothetical protein BKG69_15960 [Mycobacteroides chelonae]